MVPPAAQPQYRITLLRGKRRLSPKHTEKKQRLHEGGAVVFQSRVQAHHYNRPSSAVNHLHHPFQATREPGRVLESGKETGRRCVLMEGSRL
jgi:hypothetical protein